MPLAVMEALINKPNQIVLFWNFFYNGKGSTAFKLSCNFTVIEFDEIWLKVSRPVSSTQSVKKDRKPSVCKK